jgi:hypothetical protein
LAAHCGATIRNADLRDILIEWRRETQDEVQSRIRDRDSVLQLFAAVAGEGVFSTPTLAGEFPARLKTISSDEPVLPDVRGFEQSRQITA